MARQLAAAALEVTHAHSATAHTVPCCADTHGNGMLYAPGLLSTAYRHSFTLHFTAEADDDAVAAAAAAVAQAIEAFLKEMGLTAADLKKNEALADAIVAYHTVLGVTAGETCKPCQHPSEE